MPQIGSKYPNMKYLPQTIDILDLDTMDPKHEVSTPNHRCLRFGYFGPFGTVQVSVFVMVPMILARYLLFGYLGNSG